MSEGKARRPIRVEAQEGSHEAVQRQAEEEAGTERGQEYQESLFRAGVVALEEVAHHLEQEGYERLRLMLLFGLHKVSIAHLECLERHHDLQNRFITMMEHCRKHMPKTLYPGDVRTETERNE